MIFEQNARLSENGWDRLEKPDFQVDIFDTISEMNVLVNVRHSSRYPFSNVWVFMNTIAPDGARSIDTIECVLAEKDGAWKGSGLGGILDFQKRLKTTIFQQKGDYVFELEQAMRYGDQSQINILPEILDVGIRIERTQ
jgi:gliding motility-associated lipoprotein GldH